MERKFEFSIGEFYHLLNRGNGKMNIFLDTPDKERFLKLLFLCNDVIPVDMRNYEGESFGDIVGVADGDNREMLVDIGAYCLMPNHFHLLVREREENGISIFMKKLSTGYSMYFNKKYERTGKLFEGAFKATHADDDRYLEYLFSYIHLNPIKLIDPLWKENGIKDLNKSKAFLKNYKYSSCHDYLGIERAESLILNKEAFPEYFESKKEFEDFIEDWLNYSTQELKLRKS